MKVGSTIWIAFSCLSEEYLDPDSYPYLDIANQTGRSIEIPPQAKKVGKRDVFLKAWFMKHFQYGAEIQSGSLWSSPGCSRYYFWNKMKQNSAVGNTESPGDTSAHLIAGLILHQLLSGTCLPSMFWDEIWLLIYPSTNVTFLGASEQHEINLFVRPPFQLQSCQAFKFGLFLNSFG